MKKTKILKKAKDLMTINKRINKVNSWKKKSSVVKESIKMHKWANKSNSLINRMKKVWSKNSLRMYLIRFSKMRIPSQIKARVKIKEKDSVANIKVFIKIPIIPIRKISSNPNKNQINLIKVTKTLKKEKEDEE